jgi:hypothetical protein
MSERLTSLPPDSALLVEDGLGSSCALASPIETLEPSAQEPTPDLTLESPHTNLFQKLGSFVTRQVIRAQLLGLDIVETLSKNLEHKKEDAPSKVGNAAMRLMLVGVLSTSAVVAVSKEAKEARAASTHIYQITDGPWYLHPASPTIHSGTSDLMSTGTNFDISCWQKGDDVSGDAVWDYGTNLATGDQGYVADKGTNTPVTIGSEPAQLTELGIPECGSEATQANMEYHRTNAVDWALAHAQDPPNQWGLMYEVCQRSTLGGRP